ncbi:MAG: FCD domain-containing protein [Actinomycetota bacterium]|nr:FCD domain-containing protein [Actinomycetota bacterium]
MSEPLRRTTVDGVADLLRGRIHRGELGCGDRLPAERDLAAQLGVGRITVRGALALLQNEGYLEVRRGAAGGNFVTQLRRPYQRWLRRMRRDLAGLDDLIEFRLAVERRAVRLAAQRATAADLQAMAAAIQRLDVAADAEQFRLADSAFHDAVARAAGSPRIQAAIQQARGELFAPTDQLRYDTHIDTSRTQHLAIYDAIRSGDGAAAADAVEAHLQSTRAELVQLLEHTRR